MIRSGLPLVLAAALAASACGGNTTTPPPPPPNATVVISPATATVTAGGSQQFTATVSGSSNTAVTWTMASTASGGESPGTLSATGLYTAPASVSNAITVTVTATSAADATATASSKVTVNAPAVTISPVTATVAAGGSQQFTVTVGGSANTAVTWTMTSTASALPQQDAGTVTNAGLYTAPASVEGPFTVTVTGSAAGATASATLDVTPPATQPSLIWLNAPESGDPLFGLTLMTEDASGNVLLVDSGAGGVGSRGTTAFELDPSGKITASYTRPTQDGLQIEAVTTDGVNFYLAMSNGSAPSALLSLDANLHKRYEVAPCDPSFSISSLQWGGTTLGLLVGLTSPTTPSVIVSANPATGQFACSGGIEARSEPGSEVDSMTVSSTGNITAFGFFPGSQSVCFSGEEGFLGQLTPPGQVQWMLPFSQFAPETLGFGRSAETVENGKDVVYFAGGVTVCSGFNGLLWVSKYDAVTGDLLWTQTWDTGNTSAFAGIAGRPTPLPLPGGGVAVVGAAVPIGVVPPANGLIPTDAIFASWDASGNQTAATHIPVEGGAIINILGAALTPDGKGFYAVGRIGVDHSVLMKFSLPAALAGH